ncbi:auxin-responsive protein IAA32 [Cucumis melo var. makuwa]|uniref:Auxin-responsive protein n=3 Tax=Cucumis TaxID=3655 RepID=A0A5D3CD62_CUCMM|nr:auxin-responsive protein IAA32 [Cucumis melo var. makuwa]TYK09138.1 auxin-responsive protein IAA32 [Cucumis melo var. makuwa]
MESHDNNELIMNNSVYCEGKGENGIIDLGLSLRTLEQPEMGIMNWGGQDQDYYCCTDQEEDHTDQVVQSKEQHQKWAYVKVNMDGVIVGRKVCIFQNASYSTLALQLEDMFGRQCESGLRLFENDSEFSLFYKDGDENWRSVGDVPWKQFVEGVKRLRIARKDEAFVVIHQNQLHIS